MADSNTPLPQDEAARLASLRQLLDDAGACYELLAHAQTVASAAEGVENGIGGLAEMAPTLILETEKGMLAAVISGKTRLSYKKIKKELGLKNVSLARPEKVLQETGSAVGTVSLVNPGFPTLIDTQLTGEEFVYGGCGIPRHTLRIAPVDLIRVTQARVFDFTELK